MSETQAMMGSIARGQRFVDALKGEDPEHIVTWGEARGAIEQLIGDLRYEQGAHQKTAELLANVDRASDATITRQRAVLMELRAILAEHHDIEDVGGGDRPDQGPNWAMRATNIIDEALS